MKHDENCLFCKIVAGKIPSTKIFENDEVMAFNDIAPLAPVHILFIHKNHDANIGDLVSENPSHVEDIFLAINQIVKEKHLDKKGYRIVTNTGKEGGQSVFHTHFHLLGGTKLAGFGA